MAADDIMTMSYFHLFWCNCFSKQEEKRGHFLVMLVSLSYNSLYVLNQYEDFHQTCIGTDLRGTVKILKFGTPQTIAIIVLKIETFNVTLH